MTSTVRMIAEQYLAEAEGDARRALENLAADALANAVERKSLARQPERAVSRSDADVAAGGDAPASICGGPWAA